MVGRDKAPLAKRLRGPMLREVAIKYHFIVL